ncbi:MAG TPA: hypothetical protein VH255_00590, partial [Verrucomicrobiae bacterium]|nr:hypothetical protein [Verrucomicrobiae bacterium]
MKNRIGLIFLTVAAAALLIALIVTNKSASEQKKSDNDRIATLSNQWVETSSNLREQQDVNSKLEKNVDEQKAAYVDLTNGYTKVSGELQQSAESLKAAQQDVAARDAKIGDLEVQNQVLTQRAADLSVSITNLNTQITDTQAKLDASEGDKTFLQKELQKLMTEKADLEKQFNDLTVLREQVNKLKTQMAESRRLDWIRRGVTTTFDQKGGERIQS